MKGVKPQWLTELQEFDFSTLPGLSADTTPQNGAGGNTASNLQPPTSNLDSKPHPNDILLQLLATPEIASKRVVWRQYDHQVGTNTVVPPGSDAAVVRIKGTTKALAISTDGNAAYTCLDPYMGGAIAVAEAARNVACTGAKPIALTNCLNFGNPEKPEVYYQLKEAIRGMADAARALGIPVVSGNVSLYNENNGEAIWPTPVVGCVGLIEDVNCVVPMAFQAEGDAVLLVSAPTGGATPASIGGSEYLRLTRGIVAGKPSIDLHAAARLQRFLQDASSAGLLSSAHDIAAGGLAVALAESCIAGDAGVDAAASVSRTSDLLFRRTTVERHRFLRRGPARVGTPGDGDGSWPDRTSSRRCRRRPPPHRRDRRQRRRLARCVRIWAAARARRRGGERVTAVRSSTGRASPAPTCRSASRL